MARFADLDQDLWPDLYVGNVAEHYELPDYDPRDLLYMNESGTFVDHTDRGMGNGEDAWAAMGTTIGDIENDGTWEFYVTDHWDYAPEPRGNPLYTVNADGTLSDNICVEAGVCGGYLSWPANFADFDQDGYVDLWVGTAWDSHADLMYINDGTGKFTLHAQENFRGHTTHGGSMADYDLDGDLDIFLFSDTVRSHLFRNDVREDRNWLQVRLEGTDSNRSAIGAVIRATDPDGMTMMRMVSGGDSAHSQTSLTQHFGLGTHPYADIEITWPSGKVQDLGSLAANDFHFVNEDDGVLVEDLVSLTAVADATADTYTVTVSTNYRGRTTLFASPVNKDLVYDAERRVHEVVLQLDGQPAPPTTTVTSARGGEWQVPTVFQ